MGEVYKARHPDWVAAAINLSASWAQLEHAAQPIRFRGRDKPSGCRSSCNGMSQCRTVLERDKTTPAGQYSRWNKSRGRISPDCFREVGPFQGCVVCPSSAQGALWWRCKRVDLLVGDRDGTPSIRSQRLLLRGAAHRMWPVCHLTWPYAARASCR